MTSNFAWRQRAAIYQIYQLVVPSFKDSNGDGIGNLHGVIARLDYLEWLGVDAVWLSPIWSTLLPVHTRDQPGLHEALARILPPGRWPGTTLSTHNAPRIAPRAGSAQTRLAAMLLNTRSYGACTTPPAVQRCGSAGGQYSMV